MFLFCFRRITRKRTVPADSKPPYEFSYSVLRRATGSFAATHRLGQGGFGSVFRGTLPPSSPANNKNVAVKLMDSGSLQGEREFQNEVLFASKLDCPYVVSVLGFSSDRKRRRMLLVYELMSNGNLQDALLHRKCPELMQWKQRFLIAVDIAKGIEYLHSLDPPVIHGDIKPSNILLDQFFSAKIADFGLARLKSEDQTLSEIVVAESDGLKLESNGVVGTEDYGSVVEEAESVATTGLEEFNLGGVDQSPESLVRVPGSATASPETLEVITASPDAIGAPVSPEMMEKASPLEGTFEKGSVEGEKEVVNGAKMSGEATKRTSGKDWWWKQDNGGAESGKVKDYVMEWIGTEIKKERPNSDWSATSSSGRSSGKLDRKKSKKRLEWWISMDEEKEKKAKSWKKEKRKPVREWWREEYCEELARKKKKKKKKKQGGVYSDENGGEQWWAGDEDLNSEKKKKKRSRSVGSMDWWLDGLSGELWRGRGNSHDWMSGEIPKSGNMSSTPSMRGTVCYVAPEYGGGGDLSEKSDVYSFGVLLLVLIAGRRPLEVTGSASEIQRANLISWARHLARGRKLVDLVDKNVECLDREQALLCIRVALLCLQKSPSCRPSMKEVVGMMTGELDPPQLPAEFSPSPPSNFPFKSRKKGR